MNKDYIISIIIICVLAIAGAIYYFVFNNSPKENTVETTVAEDIVVEDAAEDITGIKYEFKNVFSDFQDDEPVASTAEPPQETLTDETIDLANPYKEIEDKINPFKNSYKNPFE
ncbi:MAG: hypothetical protein ABIG87_02840 [Patescibacteria group bacterium]